MKENTEKLLCWLADDQDDSYKETFTITYAELELLLPKLTAGGRRSLIRYLADQRLIRTERLGRQTYISLTSHGREALSAQLPAFREGFRRWQGEWSCLTFCEAPAGDPGFRYLRQLLLSHQAFSLSRGVYLYPGTLPSEVQHVCRQLYLGSVVVFTIKEWQFGDERSLVNEQYMLSDVAELLSGISREINLLLGEFENEKELTHSFQKQIFSVFDRLFEIIVQDPGITHHYFPQVEHGIELLGKLRQLYRRNNVKIT